MIVSWQLVLLRLLSPLEQSITQNMGPEIGTAILYWAGILPKRVLPVECTLQAQSYAIDARRRAPVAFRFALMAGVTCLFPFPLARPLFTLFLTLEAPLKSAFPCEVAADRPYRRTRMETDTCLDLSWTCED